MIYKVINQMIRPHYVWLDNFFCTEGDQGYIYDTVQNREKYLEIAALLNFE